jgi:hypothetical protein
LQTAPSRLQAPGRMTKAPRLRRASLSLSTDIHLNVLENSYDCM